MGHEVNCYHCNAGNTIRHLHRPSRTHIVEHGAVLEYNHECCECEREFVVSVCLRVVEIVVDVV